MLTQGPAPDPNDVAIGGWGMVNLYYGFVGGTGGWYHSFSIFCYVFCAVVNCCFMNWCMIVVVTVSLFLFRCLWSC